MAIESSTFLTDLISSGPDASKNLYDVKITRGDKSIIKRTRITKHTIPAVSIKPVTLAYQNAEVLILGPSTTVPKTAKINVRESDSYEIYKFFKENLAIDNLGHFDKTNIAPFDIEVNAYKPSATIGQYESVHTWKYTNCYATSINDINFDYSSATTIELMLGFIFEKCEES